MRFGQFASTTQFYLYGRRHCTANGWRRASANYNLGTLDTADLSSKVFIVTGANSGIGRCLSDYLASRGASLYMVCRNEARAEVAMREIRAASGNDKVHTLIGDCGLAADVRREYLRVRTRLASYLVAAEQQARSAAEDPGTPGTCAVPQPDGSERADGEHDGEDEVDENEEGEGGEEEEGDEHEEEVD